MIVIDVVRTGLLSSIPILYAMGLLSLPVLYVLVFVIAMFSMAFGPALTPVAAQRQKRPAHAHQCVDAECCMTMDNSSAPPSAAY